MGQGNRRLSFTVREWEDVAYEVDLDKIGRNPDWSMLEKGAKKLGIAAYVFRKWLIIWLAYGKKTTELPIIRSEHDKRRNISETERIPDLPTLKRGR